MRILLITPYFYPTIGGSQQYALELYRHLMAIDRSVKVDVVCYNTDKAPTYEACKGFFIYRIPCFDILPGQFTIPNYLKLIKTINKLAGRYKYDIVNSNTRFFENSWWAPFLAKYLGARSILTDHAASAPLHQSKFITLISRFIENIMARLVVEKYDLVTATNKATQNYLRKFTSKDIRLVYGGVDEKYFHPAKREKRRHIPNTGLRLGKNDILITFIGRMILTKGPKYVFKVAKEVTAAQKNVYFVFAGEGPVYEELKQHEEKNIRFIGPLGMKGVSKLLANTDILLNPSVHFEGFPNVLLEAGASGCTVMATDNGGTKELIIDRVTGLIIKPDVDKIKKQLLFLIKNRELTKRLSAALRKKIEREFSWELIAKDYLTVLEGLNQTGSKVNLYHFSLS